uniref:plant intracellular Ras-group-related LRR protein 5-like n=1 Tax=Erigeron canadensis TaxID=72917 RepID=UPI001CB94857|nr:plant intracellular Ras-group-related LRR protein 5-like [Erigeron canadensis]
MAFISKKDSSNNNSNTEIIQEIMKTYKSLPPRPTIEELEAAISVIKTVNTEEKQKLDEISSQICPQDTPPELFSILKKVRKNMVLFQSQEQRKEALHVVELDQVYQTFDELIQKASKCVLGDTQLDKDDELKYPGVSFEKEVVISDESLLVSKKINKVESFGGLVKSSPTNETNFATGVEENEKLSLMKVAALIETIAKQGGKVLDLQSKLMENIEWLPVSIGKLSNITELNLSDNKLKSLPSSITDLTALTKLDIHSNQLTNLPESFGQLVNLQDLDLHANQLQSLPESFGNLSNLINLDLSSNHFTHLPDLIGKLSSMQILIVETNDLEELPYTIGACSSLVVLKLDFNQLKGLPEAIGKLECLEILTLHYNRVCKLPTTMANLAKLKELDVSFNELEGLPESLCFATNLEILNIGKNFADMTALPRSIGNLENLQMLDISGDQIRFLPESFGSLSKLKIFRADETPLEFPPKEVTKLGAQAVVEYIADIVAKRNVKPQEIKRKRKGFWSWICMIFSG